MISVLKSSLLFKRLLKKPADAAAVTAEEGPEVPYLGRGASFGRMGSSSRGLVNPGGLRRTLTRKLSRSSMMGSGRLGMEAPKANPGLKRTLTRKLTKTNLSAIAPSPAQVAAANADDLGEVVIEIVLATGLRKQSVGPMIGPAQCAAPSPFVKVTLTLTLTRTLPLHRHRSPLTAHLSPSTLTLALTRTLTLALTRRARPRSSTARHWSACRHVT